MIPALAEAEKNIKIVTEQTKQTVSSKYFFLLFTAYHLLLK